MTDIDSALIFHVLNKSHFFKRKNFRGVIRGG